jgi:aspartate racemase
MIGIVGGVGPYAGLDLARKIFDETIASADADHLPLALLSVPERIADRTEFLLGKTDVNPAHAIAGIIRRLESMGASVIGIPCNTAHAPEIFDAITCEVEGMGGRVGIVHMIEEAAAFIRKNYPEVGAVGVLSTTGTFRAKVYPAILGRMGLDVVEPDEGLQEKVHAAVYDPGYGIKARSNPVAARARDALLEGVAALQKRGADAVILGCTEIPLAIPEKKIGDTPMVDPTLILARALIKRIAPHKLKPGE